MPFHFESVPSTQVFLKEHLMVDPKLPHLEYALADMQSDGVGRLNRSWVSEAGNLFLSVWIRDYELPLTWVPLWVGTCLLQALRDLQATTTDLKLKWPNDLVYQNQQKLAGILCERVNSGVIAGIGVNLRSSPKLNDRLTICLLDIAPKVDCANLNVKLTEKIIECLRTEPSLDLLKKRYGSDSLLQKGSLLSWTDLQTQAQGQGVFLSYGEYGELRVHEASGIERSLYSEEIKISL